MRLVLKRNIFGMLMALALATLSTAAPAFADPRDFDLVNRTGATISEVYVSPANQTDWGEDVLGNNVLKTGQKLTIKFTRFAAGDCIYDVKVVLDSGDERSGQFNLCQTSTVTVD